MKWLLTFNNCSQRRNIQLGQKRAYVAFPVSVGQPRKIWKIPKGSYLPPKLITELNLLIKQKFKS